ncbi:MAG: nucleotidyltransferase domain-containing protein [Saprospiraceae bacterium]|nr:nucleotidyltransferase domain-containing protein [Saprospiraceae bacterium]
MDVNENNIIYIILSELVKFNPKRIGIFGSYARNVQNNESDPDVLVKFNTPISLFQMIRIENSMTQAIGIKVDLVSENSIKNKRLKALIEKDIKVIYHD